jgi:hypothetical protein
MTMHLFRDRARATDPLWDVASATQIFVAGPRTVTSFALETDLGGARTVDGALVADRHPTGWFLHAVRRDDLPDAQLAPFRELVTVRSYLLLAYGSDALSWRPSPVKGQWRSVWFSLARELSELADALLE